MNEISNNKVKNQLLTALPHKPRPHPINYQDEYQIEMEVVRSGKYTPTSQNHGTNQTRQCK